METAAERKTENHGGLRNATSRLKSCKIHTDGSPCYQIRVTRLTMYKKDSERCFKDLHRRLSLSPSQMSIDCMKLIDKMVERYSELEFLNG